MRKIRGKWLRLQVMGCAGGSGAKNAGAFEGAVAVASLGVGPRADANATASERDESRRGQGLGRERWRGFEHVNKTTAQTRAQA